jgi:hypothetical protein
MLESRYQYALELLKEDGTPLGRITAEVDWAPAMEWVHLRGIRQGILPAVMPAGSALVEPIWSDKLGEPYLAGFRCTVRGDKNGKSSSGTIPLSYVQELARRASTHFVESGRLKPGEYFRYLVQAFPGKAEPASAPAGAARFSVEEITQPLPLCETPHRDLFREAVAMAPPNEHDMPVFIPRQVLEEISSLTRQAGPTETGGVLIGRLHRDTDTPEIALEITAQITARHTRRALTKLTFTADTWAAVDAAIALRKGHELYCGWWHCHNYLQETCKDCEKRKRGACAASANFMSKEDCALHRTVFPRAFSVALVMSDGPCAGLSWELFGWRYGLVAPRGLHVLGAERPVAPLQASALVAGGEPNAAKPC